jgi:hypothetical protein
MIRPTCVLGFKNKQV